MRRDWKRSILLGGTLSLVLASCTTPEADLRPTPNVVMQAEFTAGDLEQANLELAQEDEKITGRDEGNAPDGPEVVLPEGDNGGLSTQAVLPGAGGYIAYVKYDATSTAPHQLWLANQTTDAKTLVYASPRLIESGAVSLDGNKLVFTTRPTTGDYEVYRLTRNSGTITRLTNTTYPETSVSMSADGTTLVWEGRGASVHRAVVIRQYSGSSFTQKVLSSSSTSQFNPTVSGNGRYVVFVRSGSPYRVVRYTRTNNSYLTVTSSTSGLYHPSISDSGTKVVWLQLLNVGQRVRLKDVSSGTTSTLMVEANGVEHPHLTADGWFMTYGLLRNNTWDVYTRNLSTGQSAKATSVKEARSMFWQKQAVSPGTLMWDYWTNGIIYSSPALVGDSLAYVGSLDGTLYALVGGGVAWSYTIGSPLYSSPAVAADGTVYVGAYSGKVYAITPFGTLKWSYATRGEVLSSPAIAADGTIYVGSNDRYLYALDPDGSFKWRFPTRGTIDASPAVAADGTIYTGSSDGHLYAINPNGTLKWNYLYQGGLSRSVSSPGLAADGTIYIGSGDNQVYAINPDGTLKWTYPTGDIVYSGAAIAANGTVYIGSRDGRVYALNPDGTLKWSFLTGSWISSTPAIGTNGTIYVGSHDKRLYAISPTGMLKWSYSTGGQVTSSPALGADGTLYFGSYDTRLYAVSSDSFGLAMSSWPKFHHDNLSTGRLP